MLLFWPQVTVAKKHSEFMGGFEALKAAALPTCDLNKFVHPTLHDNSKPIHMIVTTPEGFDTCCLKQVSYNRLLWLLVCSMSMSFEQPWSEYAKVCNLLLFCRQ